MLILGTIPGPESLRQRQYYANPGNQFWSIIYRVFGEDKPESSYELKLRFLLERRIALWDVFNTAKRHGALDADIRDPEPNDVRGLIQRYPRVKRILLAGRTAERAFAAFFPDVPVDAFYVPSASSAYAKIPVDSKISMWKEAIGDSTGFFVNVE